MTAPATHVPNEVPAENHGRFLAFRRRVESDAVAEDILQDAYAKSLQRLEEKPARAEIIDADVYGCIESPSSPS